MHLDFAPLSDDRLDDVIAFIRRANPYAQHTWGWDTGRFIDWRWGGNTRRNDAEPGFFARHGTVVERGSTIVAVALAEVGADDHCILTSTDDGALLAAVVDRLISKTEDGPLTFLPADDATWVTDVLADRGFARGEVAGLEWGFDLAPCDQSIAPPEGFQIDALGRDREADYAAIDICLAAAFGGTHDRVAVLRSLETNPMFRPELSIVARTADDRIAAYCRGTVDAASGLCGIDPVATHPDFQGRGLGRTIIRACFATQARLGGRVSYIGSAPEPSPGSRLYRSLGPRSVMAHSRWTLVRPDPHEASADRAP